MEPPTPFDQGKNIINNTNPKSKNDFEIISDKNNSFFVTFKNFYKFILIQTNFEKDIIKKEYEKILYLDELKSNKYFSIFDTIDEIYDQLILELNNNNKKSIVEEDSKINLIIPIINIKVKEIKFTLLEKKKTEKELILDLFNELKKFKTEYISKIKELKNKSNESKNEKNNGEIIILKNKFEKLEKENNFMKEKINVLENKFNNLENENKTLKERINIFENKVNMLENETKNLKEEISFLKNENKSLNDKFNDKENELMESSILISVTNKKNKIINWIKEKINKNSINFKSVFKMTQNGYNGTDFHKYCDHIGPTLVLIKAKGNNIFGGFTPLDWGGKDRYPKDELNQTFLFSLEFNKKYDLISNKKHAIRCLEEEGPVFGNCDLKLGENMRKVEFYTGGLGNFFTKKNLALTGTIGEYQSLETQEIEIFKVIY